MQFERFHRRREEKSTIRFHPILARRQVKQRPHIQQKEVRLLAASDLQSLRVGRTGPQPVSVKEVGPYWQKSLHRTEAERFVTSEQVDPDGHAGFDGQFQMSR